MVDDILPNQEWFGDTTPNVAIDVAWPTSNRIRNPSFETGDILSAVDGRFIRLRITMP